MVETNHRYLGSEALDGFVALAIAAFTFAHFANPDLAWTNFWLSRLSVSDCIFGACFVVGWRYCFTVFSLYDKFATVRSRMGATLKAVIVMMLPFVIFLRLEHPNTITRRGVLFSLLALFCYEVNRISLASYLLDRVAARNPRRALIVGTGRRAAKAWRAIRTRYPHSIVLSGFVDDRTPDEMAPDVARRYLGTVEDLAEILQRDSVDVVLIAMPIRSCYPQMQEAVTIAERAGVTTVYLDDIYSLKNRGSDPNRWIFRELAPNQEKYLFAQGIKRLVDVVCATLALLLFSPLMLVIAAVLRVTGNRVINRRECYGYRRRRFDQLHFTTSRSVVPPKALNSAEAQGDTKPTFTTIGRVLHRTSLEKLPQLWNVLAGDMSLVGPRALDVRGLIESDQNALQRHFSVRPGLTGIRQLDCPDDVGSNQDILLDTSYVEGYSLLSDLRIMVRAVGAVLKRCSAS